MSISRVITAGTFIIAAWLVASFFRETPILTENFTAEILTVTPVAVDVADRGE